MIRVRTVLVAGVIAVAAPAQASPPATPATRSIAEVRSVLVPLRAAVHRCGREVNVRVLATLDLEVDARGRVTRASVRNRVGQLAPRVRRCVLAAGRALRFPAAAVGTTLSVPLAIGPSPSP